MSDDELLETYRASVNKAMDEANARDGFASNMSRESIVAGLRAVFDMSKGEKRAEWEAEQGETEKPSERIHQLIHDLTDPGECWFDHHGGCQEHGYLTLQPGEKCPHAEARELLAEWAVPDTTNNESEGTA